MQAICSFILDIVRLLWCARTPIGILVSVVGIVTAVVHFGRAMNEAEAATGALPECIQAEAAPHAPDGNLKRCLQRYIDAQINLGKSAAELNARLMPLSLRMQVE